MVAANFSFYSCRFVSMIFLFCSLHKVHDLFQSLEFLLQGLDSQGIIRDDVRDDEAGKLISRYFTLYMKELREIFLF